LIEKIVLGNAEFGVAFSKCNTSGILCCSNQAEKMLKHIEFFFKKQKYKQNFNISMLYYDYKSKNKPWKMKV